VARKIKIMMTSNGTGDGWDLIVSPWHLDEHIPAWAVPAGATALVGPSLPGRDMARTRKFRNVQADGKAALVIDDVLPPWQPRGVMVRGPAEALEQAVGADGQPVGPIIRIHPAQVISWGLDADADA
jgi:pyridoxamine 5'-phosphate oxidase family protein